MLSAIGAAGRDGFNITPSNTPLTVIPKFFFIGGSGDVVLETLDGTELTFTVPSGFYLMIRAKKILPATSASNIIGIV
jgi:hypothetical protein